MCERERARYHIPSVLVGRGEVRRTKETPGPPSLRGSDSPEPPPAAAAAPPPPPDVDPCDELMLALESFKLLTSTGIVIVRSGGFGIPASVTRYSRIAPMLVFRELGGTKCQSHLMTYCQLGKARREQLASEILSYNKNMSLPFSLDTRHQIRVK